MVRNPDSEVTGIFEMLGEALEKDAAYMGGKVGQFALSGDAQKAHALIDDIAAIGSFRKEVEALWGKWEALEAVMPTTDTIATYFGAAPTLVAEDAPVVAEEVTPSEETFRGATPVPPDGVSHREAARTAPGVKWQFDFERDAPAVCFALRQMEGQRGSPTAIARKLDALGETQLAQRIRDKSWWTRKRLYDADMIGGGDGVWLLRTAGMEASKTYRQQTSA